MKRMFGLLYAAFPAVLLFAQTSRPQALVEQLSSLPKRFPPEMKLSAPTTGRGQVKLAHPYCIQPDLDRKSFSVKRCQPAPVGFRLIAPFQATPPEKKPPKY